MYNTFQKQKYLTIHNSFINAENMYTYIYCMWIIFILYISYRKISFLNSQSLFVVEILCSQQKHSYKCKCLC